MSNTMEYKNYVGSVEFSESDGVFFGKVMGIRAMISYEGTTAKELVTDFHDAVVVYVYTRCLQVEEDERVFQIQFHELMYQYTNLPMCQCAHLIVPVIGILAYWHIGTLAYYFLVIQHHRHEQHQQVFVLLLFGGHKYSGA